MELNSSQQETFSEAGVVALGPGELLQCDLVEQISAFAREALPSWDSGYVDPSAIDATSDQ